MFKNAKNYDIDLRTLPTLGGGARHGHIVSAETIRKITKNYYKGKSYKEWAEYYGVTKTCIGTRMKKNGNPHPYELDYKPKQPSIFYKGKSAIEWAKELGVNKNAVYNRLKAFGHPYSKKECKKRGLNLK